MISDFAGMAINKSGASSDSGNISHYHLVAAIETVVKKTTVYISENAKLTYSINALRLYHI